MKALTSIPAAIGNQGFWKAFFFSFGSWIVGWAITFFALPDISMELGKYGVVIPLINVILVFFKQYFDELQKP